MPNKEKPAHPLVPGCPVRDLLPHEQQGEEKNQKLPKRGIKPPYKRTQHK